MQVLSDSKKNCSTSCFLPDPSVFLTPTSFALFSERAVERFMKLTQAISNMINAMMVNSRTYSIMPPTFFPSLKSLCKPPFTHGKSKIGADLFIIIIMLVLYIVDLFFHGC